MNENKQYLGQHPPTEMPAEKHGANRGQAHDPNDMGVLEPTPGDSDSGQ